ncbi:MAG: hypothetical protein WDN31_10800 [Hyphomicrobium sp.]
MFAGRTETFEPEDLALLGSIFDEAWAAISPIFEEADAETRAEARTRLAGLLLELTGKEASHEHIKQVVLHVFQHAPQRRSTAPAPEAQLSST